MQSRKLTFPNARGEMLAARLDLPVDDEPFAYALFAHCFTCSKDLAALGAVNRALTRQGIGVLRFDFTGLGESEGDFAETHFASNVEDLAAAARFLDQHYSAPALLLGHSLGGAAVLQAAADLPSAKAVATISAPGNPAHVLKLLAGSIDVVEAQGRADVVLAGRRFTITQDFLDRLQETNMRAVLQRLDRALLVLHAPLDQTVGIENAAFLFENARHPKSFVSLDRADHLLTDRADARYAGTVIAAWAARYIGQHEDHPPERTLEDNRIVVQTGAEGFYTEIMANGHALVADEPFALGGTNRGPTPYDLLVAGLGACTSMTLRMYAERKQWPLETVTVRLFHQKIHAADCAACDTQNAKIDHIEREIELAGPLDAAQRSRLLEIADRCPVHRTLEGEIVIESRLRNE